ncbi:sigma-70 family RNA polymerase sigma factor [Christensenella tenuis]|uniref:FliA/WhiG family RNA polymerase sigma factor n=1 Tax=Christensenella tenuis TaxID=2763033 RepID=A0ABR7EAF4_9FIRM|nr:FliA/WhiG family RNA polymerase sigma factor [Christensenella tenuis]MBC5646754.1 FliA/WhiG family RNA polymerase sigma factor [Christensenella tenuis]
MTKKHEREPKELWDAYIKDPTVENRNQIVENYLYLVKAIVLRMSPLYQTTFRDYDDLISNGVLGLMDAVQKFDPKRNIKFETYAQRRIRGAILDYMRQQDWIPNNMRKEIKQVKQAYDDLILELQRPPEYEEVAKRLGISPGKVKKIFFNDYQYSLLHFEDIINEVTYRSEFVNPEPDLLRHQKSSAGQTPEENILRKETHEELVELLRTLPENERIVLDLYYVKELKVKDIAHIMDLTESRISQIHRSAIRKIADMYEKKYQE